MILSRLIVESVVNSYMKKIYLDYAATTPVKKEVLDAMLPFFGDLKTNPESAMRVFEKTINAPEGSVRFNSGGTVGSNEIIRNLAYANPNKGHKIISSTVEHPAVYKVLEQLEKEGFEICKVPVDPYGRIDMSTFKRCLSDDTVLVTVMMINNEVGTRQPIEAISQLCKAKDIPLHVDAVQALGNAAIDVTALDVHAMNFSAHKLYAPKGCGAVYVKPGTSLENLMNKDACGETVVNLPYIIGFAKALELAYEHLAQNNRHKRMLKLKLAKALMSLDCGLEINGEMPTDSDLLESASGNHPGILNVYVPHMDGDSLVINYDFNGIAISSGSACSSGALSASHVLMAMGRTEKEAKKCIRLTIGDLTTESEIDEVIQVTKRILKGI